MRHSLIASCVVVCVVPALSAPAFAAHHGYRQVAYRQVAYRQAAYRQAAHRQVTYRAAYHDAVSRHLLAMQPDDTRHYYYDYAPATARHNEPDFWQGAWQGSWQSYLSSSNWGTAWGRSGLGQNGELDGMAAAQAGANGIPVSLVERVIRRESGGNPRAVNAGNYGLMQIRLGTARAMGFTGAAAELLDPQVNMTYAVRYLAGAYRAANGNESRAVALYASGYYAQAKAQGFSPYASPTSGYGAYAQAGFNDAEGYGNTAPIYRVRHYRRRAA